MGPPPMIPTVMPMAHPHMMAGPPMTAMPMRTFRPHNSTQQRQQNRPRPALVPQVVTGPTVTVFVGNITDKAPDQMIRHILAACGTVVSWKRVQGQYAFIYRIVSKTNVGRKK
ncbi:putative RNA-binding protein 25 [Homalodisca vitripennis]|nr:putative RNA-binding protein 25 [Homalodisca vitripennis]